jgi:uncharacterized protein (TIGR03437 family)
MSGLQLVTLPWAFTVTAPNPRQMYMALSTVPSLSVYPGAVVTLPVGNLPGALTPGAVAVSINDRPAAVLAVAGNQVTFQAPAGITPGVGIVRMIINGENVLPSAVAVTSPPPTILGAFSSADTAVDDSHPARPGDTLNLAVSNLAEPGAIVDPQRIKVLSGAQEHTVVYVTPNPAQPDTHLVTVTLNPRAVPVNGQISLVLSVDGRASQPFALAVRLP